VSSIFYSFFEKLPTALFYIFDWKWVRFVSASALVVRVRVESESLVVDEIEFVQKDESCYQALIITSTYLSFWLSNLRGDAISVLANERVEQFAQISVRHKPGFKIFDWEYFHGLFFNGLLISYRIGAVYLVWSMSRQTC
jgi:hypothetical protein